MIDTSNYRLTETATSESLREIMLLRGLVVEATTGMRLTAKAPKCSTIVRREYGFRGNHERLAEQLLDDMLTRGVLEEVSR